MILSHKHKFVFIKTQKTAGTSLELALRAICGPDDIITPISEEDEAVARELGLPGPANFGKGECQDDEKWRRSNRFFNHMSLQELYAQIPENNLAGYFKFCVERDPLDKLLSFYHFWNVNERFDSMREWIEQTFKRPKFTSGNWKFGFELYQRNGQIGVDRVFFYEDLNRACQELSTRFGVSVALPNYRAKGRFRSQENDPVICAFSSDWARIHFAREYAAFHYKPPAPKGVYPSSAIISENKR